MWFALYFLIGCLVTAMALNNYRGMQAEAGGAVFLLVAGPFIWPVLIPQQIESMQRNLEEQKKQAAEQKEAFDKAMQDCPEGFNFMCTAYLAEQGSPQRYQDFLQHLATKPIPEEGKQRDFMLAMAAFFAGHSSPPFPEGKDWKTQRTQPEQIENDMQTLLDKAPPTKQEGLRTVRAVMLKAVLQDIYLQNELRAPYEDPELARRNAHVLHSIVADLAPLIKAYNSPSLGLASVYEAYANALENPQEKELWQSKALAEYAGAARHFSYDHLVVPAIVAFFSLTQNEHERLKLLQSLEGHSFTNNYEEKDWLSPICHMPYINTLPPVELLKGLLSFFKEPHNRLEATKRLLLLFNLPKRYADRRFDTVARSAELRTAVYSMSCSGAWPFEEFAYIRSSIQPAPAEPFVPDQRWPAMVLELLQNYDPSFATYQAFYEAEAAWFMGDKREAERLLERYIRTQDTKKYYRDDLLPIAPQCQQNPLGGFNTLFKEKLQGKQTQ